MKTTFVLMLGFVVPLAISCHVSDVDSDVDTNATSPENFTHFSLLYL